MKFYTGLIAQYNNRFYRAINYGTYLTLFSDKDSFKGKKRANFYLDEIESVFRVDYRVVYRGIEGSVLRIHNNELQFIFDIAFNEIDFPFERFERDSGLKTVKFEECDSVFIQKTPFRNFAIPGDRKIEFRSYEELVNTVIFE